MIKNQPTFLEIFGKFKLTNIKILAITWSIKFSLLQQHDIKKAPIGKIIDKE